MITIGATNNYKENRHKFENIVSKLDSLSPLKTLVRGYSITQKNGKVIKSVKQLKKDDDIEITFSDGTKHAQIK